MKPSVTPSMNFCSDGVDRSVSSTFLLGLGFESSSLFGCHQTNVSQRQRARETKCQDYHGKMRRWEKEIMAFFLLLFLGKESSVGFCKAGPFEDSTAYDET